MSLCPGLSSTLVSVLYRNKVRLTLGCHAWCQHENQLPTVSSSYIADSQYLGFVFPSINHFLSYMDNASFDIVPQTSNIGKTGHGARNVKGIHRGNPFTVLGNRINKSFLTFYHSWKMLSIQTHGMDQKSRKGKMTSLVTVPEQFILPAKGSLRSARENQCLKKLYQ